MKIFFSVFFLFVSLGSLSAQTFIPNLFSKSNFVNATESPDTIKILAILVDFQEDMDGATFGNGKFGSIYSRNYGTDIIDPLPHDQQYFNDHLLFAKNYFKKVSNEKLVIEFTVLPDIISVSKTIRNYSPSPGSDDFTSLADFCTEAWTLANQINPGFDFSAYNLFAILHAGVGRDIKLPGSIGNERDLPSVYLSNKLFKDIYGESFNGIPVSNGNFFITNTMILPETESRELNDISGTTLIEATINGLLAASIGNYLGLPDLFDTETGLSAIGRFGLMDGQGIFAYLGAFPPEPSPWSKIRLGWADPVTVGLSNSDLSVVTKLAAQVGDTVILKVLLNSSEYYLIENRSRDANNDGSIVTYSINGTTYTKTFTEDTAGYQSFDIESLSGVITDVDEFDWAVPGNGIVIWHVDDNVINDKIEDNKVNTDKLHRGVDVEEADGIQDIGETFTTVLGDEIIGEGTEEDFWFAANPSLFYENRFAKDTRPNTLTNSWANSLITLIDFSGINKRMTFKIEFGDSVVRPLYTNELGLVGELNSFSTSQYQGVNTYQIIVDSNLIVTDDQSIIDSFEEFSEYKTASGIINDVQHYYGGLNNNLNFIISDGNQNFAGSVNLAETISSPLVINQDENSEYEIIIGTKSGKILFYNPGSLPSTSPTLKESITVDTTLIVKKIASSGNYYSFIVDPKNTTLSSTPVDLFFDSNGFSYPFISEIPVDLCLTKDQNSNYMSIVLTSTNKIHIFSNGELSSSFTIDALNQISSISISDIKQDGINYILVNNGNNVEAYNLRGAIADNFPFTDPEEIGFVGTPIAADFEGDSKSEVISVTIDGRIFAIDGGTGKVVSGFPISCGAKVDVVPVLFNADGKTNLAVLNADNNLSAWSISSVEGIIFWAEENGNAQNTSFVDAAENTNRINEFFPTSRAYNYPNPVYEGTTNIRYYVSEDSKINIKIFDLAGDFVAELNDNAEGGIDNETIWNVSDIQSGVYLARIEATGNSGKTEHAIIKIAIVK